MSWDDISDYEVNLIHEYLRPDELNDDDIVGLQFSLASAREELKELYEKHENLKSKSMVSGAFSMTEWCQKNQDEGRGPCGACASCCKALQEEIGDLNSQLGEIHNPNTRVQTALNNLLDLGKSLKECKPWLAKLATRWDKGSDGMPIIVEEHVLDIADLQALAEDESPT